jgi:hypothetical protein
VFYLYLFSDMEDPDDIFDFILDHEFDVVNAVADVAVIGDLQQVMQQDPVAPQRRAPRNPIW